METPEKEAQVQAPSLHCTLIVETQSPLGVMKSVTHKNIKIIIGRNQFRDIILHVEGSKHSFKFSLRGEFQLHTRFMKKGKATISLRESHTNLMISNAPPNQLLVFLKMLSTKKAVTEDTCKGFSSRKRLMSSLPSTFEEISPLTLQEYKSVKERKNCRAPLKEVSGNVPGSSPVSSKRSREDSKVSPGRKLKVARPLRPYVLTQEQKRVLQSISSGQNVFFTGSAGTGKSFLLQKIIATLPPDFTYATASTGVAASHIGGSTLHNFAGVGTGDYSLEQCIERASSREVALHWRKCKHLIVDEVSMVDGVLFEKLEAVARAVRRSDKPFGGIQLILCGDFLQLPPVTRGNKERVFCFQTPAWDRCINVTLELTDVKRQDDQEFIRILQAVRLGRCTDEVTERLRQTANNSFERNGIKATRLCTHRKDVDHINQKYLSQLPGTGRVFYSVDSHAEKSHLLDAHTQAESQLVLKQGSQVMLTKNIGMGRRLVNGACGLVTSFTSNGNPVVKFQTGLTCEITPEKWRMHMAGGSVITRIQLPLKLAWAFSIHKSQGMTLDLVEMSLSQVFEVGQVYVALSRARNLQGLRVMDFDPSVVRAHPDVLRFYHDLRRAQYSHQ